MEMRTYRIVLRIALVLALLMYTGVAFGDAGHGKSVEEVLTEIREKLDLGPNDRIDPDRVSDGDLEELGEAVMGLMHPDTREHEFMDEMMGGEGSKNLEYMHRLMGYRYLSGELRGTDFPGIEMPQRPWGMGNGRHMMGWGMHGSGRRGVYRTMPGSMMGMMGGFSPFYFGRISMWILLVVLIAVVVWLVVRVNRRGKSASGSQGFSPLDIAKQRYAKGEISRGEYETLKRDLQ
jgi:putative membrane protein